MKKLITIALIYVANGNLFAQTNKMSVYAKARFSETIYDHTLGNNPWAMGLGLQTFLHVHPTFKPILEITADAYLEDDKVLRINSDGTTPDNLSGMVNVLAGLSFHPVRKLFLSFTSGPSFANGRTLFAIKPSAGFYFSNQQKWMGTLSYLNVFNREAYSKDDFGAISLSIGVRLF